MRWWLGCFFVFPDFKSETQQTKKLILRKRYWLYYALTFMSGARRQIFVVFAGFLMVEKFGYTAADITLLFLINYLFNFLFAKKIGKIIGIVGERKALVFEYVGLVFVFVGYGLVQTAHWAAILLCCRSPIFRSCSCYKNLLPKDCRSSGYGVNSRCRFYYQSHCSGSNTGIVWSDMACFAIVSIFYWRWNGSGFVAAFI